jgi:hypothetical protein
MWGSHDDNDDKDCNDDKDDKDAGPPTPPSFFDVALDSLMGGFRQMVKKVDPAERDMFIEENLDIWMDVLEKIESAHVHFAQLPEEKENATEN